MRALLTRLKNVAGIVLGRADPFRNLQRDAVEVTDPSHGQFGQDLILHRARISSEVEEAGGSTEVIEVEALRLDALLARHGIDSFDLLCIDVEGAEIEVLGSFGLRRVRPNVVCIENTYLDRAIWQLMRRAGYRPYARIRQDEIYLARGFRHG